MNVARRLALVWGVQALPSSALEHVGDIVTAARPAHSRRAGQVRQNIVITAGAPAGQTGYDQSAAYYDARVGS